VRKPQFQKEVLLQVVSYLPPYSLQTLIPIELDAKERRYTGDIKRLILENFGSR
jgi:hypothetical protein